MHSKTEEKKRTEEELHGYPIICFGWKLELHFFSLLLFVQLFGFSRCSVYTIIIIILGTFSGAVFVYIHL